MKFSEAWLREWVDPGISTAELVEQLTMAGLEVDGVEPVAAEFSGVVVGEVRSVVPHPNADKLRICRVDTGGDEPLQIVCGAANVREGMKAPTALVGGVLPGGLKIKQAKLRGEASFGMLSAAAELGLAESSEGLMDLPEEAPVGASVRDVLALDDHSIEVDLTPNRGDCLSIAGIAREVGVINRLAVQVPPIEAVAAAIPDEFDIRLEAPERCPRYLGRVIRGVNTGAETPLWMQERLRRSGLRSLGPAVDVTNYVLLELGQPMHAFDLNTLQGGIVVRLAREGESLTLLDGQQVELRPDSLVIADQTRPLALAGIMGGADSAVGEGTCDLLLECAFFEPTRMAGQARSYGLHTDSSHRFERGVDPQLQQRALQRATGLMLEIMGGQAGPVLEQSRPEYLPQRESIELRRRRIRRMLGLTLDDGEVGDILGRLGLEVAGQDDGWAVIPPSYRFDLAIEADLIEELARVHGYAKLPGSAIHGTVSIRPSAEAEVEQDALADLLVARGYQEAITYSFVDPQMLRVLDPQRQPVALANPLSEDLSVMRTTLWAGLLQAARRNLNRQQERVRLFESGLRFLPGDQGLAQNPALAGVIAGPRHPEYWHGEARPVDFYDLKGDVEALLGLGGCGDEICFEAVAHPALHPGQCARILRGDQEAGWLGLLHPRVRKALDVVQPLFLFELDLGVVRSGRLPAFQPLSRFPSVRRDLAVVVEESVSASSVRDCIRRAAPASLKEVEIFDVYRGKGIETGRKSLALGLILQDYSRTLTDQEVDVAMQAVLEALAAELGATLRE